MSYEFEWDANKADANLRKHEVSFHEASTVFADPLAMLMTHPDHSLGEERDPPHSTHQRAPSDAQRKAAV